MAETVQAVMDSMVPALHDFVHLKIFSESEIKALVDRRRNWEYMLIRKETRKEDWLEYVAFEMNLLKLQTMRKARSPAAASSPSSPSQFHIEQHIHFIFTRALRKFKTDVTMWMQYIDFAKKNDSNKRLGRIYAEALQIHPHSELLWLSSAEWEFFSNNNAKSARVVMQRSLRTIPKSEQLWLQYFNLELHYVQRMRGRREILQLEGGHVEEPGGIASIVYRNAIKSTEGGLEFRLKFLEQCSSFPQTEKLEREIMDSIASDFPNDPEAYIARAKYLLPNFAAALNLMDEGLSNSSSPDKYRIPYLDFLREIVESEQVPESDLPVVTSKYHEVVQSTAPSPELALLQAELTSISPISELLSSFPTPTSLEIPSPYITKIGLLLSHAHLRLGEYDEASKVLTSALWKLNAHSPQHLESFAALASSAIQTLLITNQVNEVESIIKKAPLDTMEGLLKIYLRHAIVEDGEEGA
eukprot:CAMPEP_0118635270 /NCGR_PEP_ID=MMETSP0785-20121206/1988_1 /TAXON_ID=91992 /ORGANISM="Bolidomonas pacifica, Strain CCMP 1866" /LENGTH=469 /DNA_ID=CAMNT_0006526295 /DNA_START=131 /DNA_END=1537 /DNA_ORIENTATION=+